MSEKCGNCRFYHLEQETRASLETDEPLHPDDYESECRRYPPVRGDRDYYGAMGNADVNAGFFSGPIVQVIGWCGEFKARALDAINP